MSGPPAAGAALIERLVAWSVRRRGLVLALSALFVAVTATASRGLEFDALPDITSNQVAVLTRAPGLGPEEVERRVTRPIEAALGGLPGLDEHRSLSRYGLSAITVVFEDDVDPYRARQIVKERLDTTAELLPAGVDPPELGPLSGGLGEIFHFTLGSPERTTAELLELAQIQLAPLLREVPGVVEVNTWGGQRRTLDVVADPVRLAQRRLTLEELGRAVEASTGARPAGGLTATGTSQVLVRAAAFPSRPDELGQAMVATEGGAPVRLADLGSVEEGALPRLGAATANGRGETVYVMAQMLLGANALEVMEGIHARLPAVHALLPRDVRLEIIYDRSVLVTRTLRTVGLSLLEGGALVVVVLFLMLGSLRAGLLVAAAIPLSMLGATFAMTTLGIPGNLMSLGALDFGLVVDGAVVVVESIFHRLREVSARVGTDRDAFRAEVTSAATQVARPAFFGVAVIALVYVPVLTLTGVDGKMFRPMALTVVFALATSLVLTLVTIPAGAAVFLRAQDVPARDPILVRFVERVYPPALAACMRRPLVVAAAALLALAGGAVLFARTGTEFAPQLDEGDLVIQTTRAADVSLEAAVAQAGALERAALAAAPEVEAVVSRIGSPAVATDVMGLEQADVFVRLAARDKGSDARPREAIIEDLERALTLRDPGAALSFTQPIQMRFNELLGGAVTDVTVGVYGQELAQLRKSAAAIERALTGVPGVVDVRLLVPPDVEVIDVRPRPLEASQAGLTVGEILDGVQALRTGLPVGVTYDGPVRLPIRLRLAAPTSVADLPRLPLPNHNGLLVPLGQVAAIETHTAPIAISHQNGQRRILVGFNVRGVELGRAVEAARARVEAAVTAPPGYRLVWGGQYETLEQATKRLTLVVPIVLVVVLGLLFAAFGGLRPVLVIFLNVPFACVGGIVALAARGLPVSMSAAIGFIALSGVAVLNGLVLMARVRALEAEGLAPDEAAAAAARGRVRPVLMTALVAALGFVPMALATGIGAEVQRPLATVVVGGLQSSTLLTLLVLPSIYPYVARLGRRPRDA